MMRTDTVQQDVPDMSSDDQKLEHQWLRTTHDGQAVMMLMQIVGRTVNHHVQCGSAELC